MSSDHDRLLAQGPRVAPEPRVGDDAGRVRAEAPMPASTPASTPASRSRAGARPGSGAGLWRRLLPVLVAAGLAARAFGSGRAGAAVFGLVAAVAITLVVVRKARRR